MEDQKRLKNDEDSETQVILKGIFVLKITFSDEINNMIVKSIGVYLEGSNSNYSLLEVKDTFLPDCAKAKRKGYIFDSLYMLHHSG